MPYREGSIFKVSNRKSPAPPVRPPSKATPPKHVTGSLASARGPPPVMCNVSTGQ